MARSPASGEAGGRCAAFLSSPVPPDDPFPGDPGPLPRGVRVMQFVIRQPSWVFKLAASAALLVFAAVLALLLLPAAVVAVVIFVVAAAILAVWAWVRSVLRDPRALVPRPGRRNVRVVPPRE